MPTATRIRDHCLAPARAVDARAAGGYRQLSPSWTPSTPRTTPSMPSGTPVAPATPGRGGRGRIRSGGQDAEGAAGWPVFGQFVAHDLTADRSQPLTHRAELAEVRNARSPRANLEVVYGDGPVGMPFLYDRDDPAKLLVGRNNETSQPTCPATPRASPCFGDPRNDVHLLMSQLHVAMLWLHNALVDRLRDDGVAEAELFAEGAPGRRLALPVGPAHRLPAPAGRAPSWPPSCWPAGPGTTAPTPGAAWIPLEFADAAYRYGHSQIRERYQVNRQAEPVPLFPDLLGFRPVPAGPGGRLVVPVRPARAATGPAGQADRRPPRDQPHPAARRPSPGSRAATTTGSLAVRDLQARPGGRAAVGRGCGPPPRGRAAHPRAGRPRPGGLAAGDAALVLPAQGGRAPRRGRAPWPGGWPPGRGGPGRHRRRRRRVVTGPWTQAGAPRLRPPGRAGSVWPTCWTSPPRWRKRPIESRSGWAGGVRGTAGVVPRWIRGSGGPPGWSPGASGSGTVACSAWSDPQRRARPTGRPGRRAGSSAPTWPPSWSAGWPGWRPGRSPAGGCSPTPARPASRGSRR